MKTPGTVSPLFTNSQIIFSCNSNWAHPKYLALVGVGKAFQNYADVPYHKEILGE
jgi:hypothetical protein